MKTSFKFLARCILIKAAVLINSFTGRLKILKDWTWTWWISTY